MKLYIIWQATVSAENNIQEVVRSSEIVGYELRMNAGFCKEIRAGWLTF
jgi:hypothetical protein